MLFDPFYPPIPWATHLPPGWVSYWREYTSGGPSRLLAIWRVIVYRLVGSRMDWEKRDYIIPTWLLVIERPSYLWSLLRAKAS